MAAYWQTSALQAGILKWLHPLCLCWVRYTTAGAAPAVVCCTIMCFANPHLAVVPAPPSSPAQAIGVPISKLALHTACGGVEPATCMPVVFDVGTDNEDLLRSPLYVGVRHRWAGWCGVCLRGKDGARVLGGVWRVEGAAWHIQAPQALHTGAPVTVGLEPWSRSEHSAVGVVDYCGSRSQWPPSRDSAVTEQLCGCESLAMVMWSLHSRHTPLCAATPLPSSEVITGTAGQCLAPPQCSCRSNLFVTSPWCPPPPPPLQACAW